MDRTVDTDTQGRLSLIDTVNAESGDTISNVQQRVNENTIKQNASQVLLASESMTLDVIHKLQYFRIAGNAAPVTLTTPFINTPKDGTRIYIVGTDDTNTVTLSVEDVAGGLYINGDATLKRGYMLQLIFDAELNRYFEIGRNF